MSANSNERKGNTMTRDEMASQLNSCEENPSYRGFGGGGEKTKGVPGKFGDNTEPRGRKSGSKK